jgi:Tol biopolymer transport system component
VRHIRSVLTVVALSIFIGALSSTVAQGAELSIVFSRGGQLFSLYPGASEEQLTSGEYFSSQPAVSPDGETIAYARLPSDFSTPSEIYTLAREGGTPKALVTLEGSNTAPAWSPDGTEIAFAHQAPEGGVSNIYKINLSSKTITQLTHLSEEPTNAAGAPAWSPDGTKIAFIESTDASGFGLAVMDSDGSDIKKIVTTGMVADVGWSHDGTHLFYTRDERTETSAFQIYTIAADGTENKAITEDSYQKPELAVSPDGMKIIFMRGGKPRELGNYSVWEMNTDGTEQEQLTSGHEDVDPTWAPPVDSDSPPEFGRCIKVAKGLGKYASASCTTVSAKTNSYEWYPAFGGPEPLKMLGFKTAIKSASELKLETTGKQKIDCRGESSDGEYGGNKSVSDVTLTLTGCRRLLLKGATEDCQSSGAKEGEVVTDALDGELGVITVSSEGPAKNKIGLDLKPASEEAVAAFECGTTVVSIDGSVIVQLSVNKMVLTQTLKYSQSKAVQKPTKFEGATEDVLDTRLGTGVFEQTGLTLTSTLTNEEDIEINSIF